MVIYSGRHNAPDSSLSLFILSKWFADVLMSLQVLPLRDSEEICHATVTKWSDDAEMMRMFQLFCLKSASVKFSL